MSLNLEDFYDSTFNLVLIFALGLGVFFCVTVYAVAIDVIVIGGGPSTVVDMVFISFWSAWFIASFSPLICYKIRKMLSAQES